MLAIGIEWENVPGMQPLSVRGGNVERRDLVAEEAPLLRDIDVLEPGQGHPV